MYKRLIILSLIIIVALCGLSWLGYRAISMWAQGIEGTRITEFADVAEQIRVDVNETLYAFMEQEKNRPYTDYRYYSISGEPFIISQETQSNGSMSRSVTNPNYRNNMTLREQGNILNSSNQQVAIKTFSPLADNIEHDLAYFNFQYDSDSNTLTSPNGFIEQQPSQVYRNDDGNLNELLVLNYRNVKDNLLPVVLEKFESGDMSESPLKKLDDAVNDSKLDIADRNDKEIQNVKEPEKDSGNKVVAGSKSAGKGSNTGRTGSYNIDGLQNTNAEPVVQKQSREFVTNNIGQNDWVDVAQQEGMINQYQFEQQKKRQSGFSRDELSYQQIQDAPVQVDERRQQILQQPMAGGRGGMGGFGGGRMQTAQEDSFTENQDMVTIVPDAHDIPAVAEPNQAEIVEVIIEPFSTIVIPEENGTNSIFANQVFMVRRVKFEGKELFQGFQLNERKLLEKVEESTKRFMRDGMSYELGRKLNESSAYTAILDFGFGHLLLNLFENDPGRIVMQINHLRNWYFSIITIVFLAVAMAVISLWLNAREQIRLAQKKDDFVSAVSHELRTPLTSIRMHAEMLEKNWIKSENKLGEYYRSMRTESERLSRLIENVLDFSRIQKGRKKYLFKLGDINKCVSDVVEMMRAYAAQRGFKIQIQTGECREISFDSDAVTQIVVNLLDNAVKYSSNSEDKTITVRTKSDGEYVLIEVEDHGPGIPHRQRNKIFQEFYRIGAESTRETTGSGLGLALVKRFAQAHNGFVEIISARPTGAIFRVSLAAKLQNSI